MLPMLPLLLPRPGLLGGFIISKSKKVFNNVPYVDEKVTGEHSLLQICQILTELIT